MHEKGLQVLPKHGSAKGGNSMALPARMPAHRHSKTGQRWTQPENIAKLHLAIWTSKEIRIIRKTLCRMWHLRQTFNAALTADNTISPNADKAEGS